MLKTCVYVHVCVYVHAHVHLHISLVYLFIYIPNIHNTYVYLYHKCAYDYNKA